MPQHNYTLLNFCKINATSFVAVVCLKVHEAEYES